MKLRPGTAQDVIFNREPAAAAIGRPSPQLRPRALDRVHAMERSLRRQRFIITHRRRTLG